MFQKLRPLSNHVWVELIDKNEKTAGGLYIPDAAKEKAQTGKVLATGPGKQQSNGSIIPMQVAIGDIIFFGKFAGVAANDRCIVIKEDDILGIIEA